MKHNEMKAFFKKELQKAISDEYRALSIDRSNNERDIYIIDSEMNSKILVSTWFTCDRFEIKVYDLNKKVTINKYRDMEYKACGSYIQIHKFNCIINEIKKKLEM